MRRIAKTDMLNRLARLKEWSTTAEVSKTLRLSKPTLNRWLADKQFHIAGVAYDSCANGAKYAKWLWSKEKLTAWVQAVMKLTDASTRHGYRPKKRNPSVEMNPKSAAKMLGIPEGHRAASRAKGKR